MRTANNAEEASLNNKFEGADRELVGQLEQYDQEMQTHHDEKV